MKVLHVVASLSLEWGGPTKVVVELTEKLAEKGIEITIFSPFKKGEESEVVQPKGVKLHLFRQGFMDKLWTSYSADFTKAIQKEVNQFDIVHIHEIWHYPHYITYREAKKIGKPYIVTIHGALEPWCLNYKAFKKKIYTLLIQKHILKEADAIHAITYEEVKHIKGFGVNNTIVMIPNGINPEEFANLPSREELKKIYPKLIGKKVILFLGRIHPIKGLDLLAKAFSIVAGDRDDVCLLVVGPDNNGYKAKIEKFLKKKGVLDRVIFTGMLEARKKLIALSGSNISVIPSYSEVRSIVALEAMSCNLPVIITKQCQFSEIAEADAGIVIKPDSKPLAQALNKLLNDFQLCKKMGENGKKLVLEKYTWDKIADKMIKVYEEILNRKDSKR